MNGIPQPAQFQQHVFPDYNRANSLQDESLQRLIENHETQNQAIQQLIQQHLTRSLETSLAKARRSSSLANKGREVLRLTRSHLSGSKKITSQQTRNQGALCVVR